MVFKSGDRVSIRVGSDLPTPSLAWREILWGIFLNRTPAVAHATPASARAVPSTPGCKPEPLTRRHPIPQAFFQPSCVCAFATACGSEDSGLKEEGSCPPSSLLDRATFFLEQEISLGSLSQPKHLPRRPGCPRLLPTILGEAPPHPLSWIVLFGAGNFVGAMFLNRTTLHLNYIQHAEVPARTPNPPTRNPKPSREKVPHSLFWIVQHSFGSFNTFF